MIKWIINSNNSSRDAYIWNTVSSTLLAGMSALLLIIVVRYLNELDAAIFSLGFSIAQMMLTIGYFDMRAYQSTDVNMTHPFKRYFTSRLLTCSLMLIISLIYVISKNYDFYKSMIIFFLCIFKSLDALEDVIHGLFQVNGRLDIAGKLQTLRILLCMISFSLSIIIFKNLMFSILLIIILSLIILVFLNFPIISNFDTLSLDNNFKELSKLLLACVPLFIGSYLSLYIGNSPKYAIDTFMDPVYQTYFNILFMPSYVVNLFSGFAFRPLLTSLAKDFAMNKYKKYLHTIFKLIFLIVCVAVVCELGAYFLGIPVLSLVYNVNLSSYKIELLILIFSGAISSLGTIIYYALTIMRNQKLLLISYVLTGVAAIFVSPILVHNYGLMGASVANLLLYSIRTSIFIVIFIVCFKRNTRRSYE